MLPRQVLRPLCLSWHALAGLRLAGLRRQTQRYRSVFRNRGAHTLGFGLVHLLSLYTPHYGSVGLRRALNWAAPRCRA